MSKEEATLTAEDKEVRKSIISWAKATKGIKGITCGGSGTILLLENAVLPACLKIIRCKHCSSLGELQKLISEVLNILRCSTDGNVVPILKNDFKNLTKKEITNALESTSKISEIISGGIKSGKTDLNFEIFKPLRDIIFVFKHNPKDMSEHTHIGYLTPYGMPVDRMLEYFSHIENGASVPDENGYIPIWIFAYAKPEYLPTYTKHTPINANKLVNNIIKDMLISIISVHESGLVHLDVKEANLLAIKPKKIGDCPKFALFDFGSAQEADEKKRKRDEFEGTYQYLPKFLQRKNPLSQFTSHNKVNIKFSELKDVCNSYALDLHAIGQIIMNIVTDARYRRLSSFLDDKEDAIAFSQLISLDFKEDDKDSIYNKIGVNPEKITEAALRIYINGEDLRKAAQDDWNLWYDSVTKSRDTVPAQSEKGISDYPLIVHPASKLFSEENKVSIKIMKKAKSVSKKENPKLLKELQDNLKKIKDKYCKHYLKFNFLGNQIDFSNLLETKLIKRLKNIKQLSLTYSNPPEGTSGFALHNRLDHSVGMVEVTRLYLISLLKNSGWFRYRFEIEDGIYLLLASLLHDIGHFSCSHYLEDTKIFPTHDAITNAIIKGDIQSLWVDTKADEKIFKEKKWVLFKQKQNEFKDHSKGKRCDFDHAIHAPCQLNSCPAEDLTELHNKIDVKLGKSSLKYLNFLEWYDDLIEIDNPEKSPKRLINWVLHGILSGPIDADKVHYIVNDSINCNLSLASAFEGVDFIKLLENLSIPIRHLEESPSKRFCLGLKEDATYLAELVMFIREALFGQVYWSSFSRAATVMLRYILLESFYWIYNNKDRATVGKFIGSWVRADDLQLQVLLRGLVKEADSIIQKKIPAVSNIRLEEIYKYIFEMGPEKKYIEICKIYPSDRAAYGTLSSNIKQKQIEIGGEALMAPSRSIEKRIREIVGDVLSISAKQLPHGAVLIDIPGQKTSKKKESSRLVLVDALGFGRTTGKLWDTIESNIDDSVRVIRIFLHPEIIKLDKEDCLNIRRALITRMS